MTGEQIRAARERAGLTQEQLGRKVGVTLRTIGNWERGTSVPRNRLGALRAALREHLDEVGPAPLQGISDVELLAEIARRFARGQDEKVGGEHDQRSAPIATDGGVATDGAGDERGGGATGSGSSRGPQYGDAAVHGQRTRGMGRARGKARGTSGEGG